MINPNKPDYSTISIFNIIIISEAMVLLISTIWMAAVKLNLANSFHFNRYCLYYGISTGLLIAITSKILYVLGDKFNIKLFQSLKNIYADEIYNNFKKFSLNQIFMISLISGFCEEIFFRGVLQEEIGIIPCNLIFAFLHAPKFSFWLLFILTLLAGLLFSYLKIHLHSLWPPIIAHSLNNFISFLFLKYIVTIKKN